MQYFILSFSLLFTTKCALWSAVNMKYKWMTFGAINLSTSRQWSTTQYNRKCTSTFCGRQTVCGVTKSGEARVFCVENRQSRWMFSPVYWAVKFGIFHLLYYCLVYVVSNFGSSTRITRFIVRLGIPVSVWRIGKKRKINTQM